MWYTDEICELINLRDKAKSKRDWTNYKLLRNRAVKLIKQAKKSYYIRSIKNSKGDSRKLWQYLKSVVGENNKGGPKILKMNDTLETDRKNITNSLNKHFVDVNLLPRSQLICQRINLMYHQKNLLNGAKLAFQMALHSEYQKLLKLKFT